MPSPAFEPGQIVLASASKRPAWPAVVVAESDVPAGVQDAKPDDPTSVAVLFLNDTDVVWVAPPDVSALAPEEAQKAAKVPRTKKALKEAYLIAADVPPYAELIAALAPVEEPAEEDQDEVVPADGTRKRPARERRSAKRPRPVVSEPEPEEESEYVDGSEETGTDAPAEDELPLSQDARLAYCSHTRAQLQAAYFGADGAVATPADAEAADVLVAALRTLLELEELELGVARRSRLLRVLRAVVDHCSPRKDVRAVAEELLARFDTQGEPIIRGIPQDLAKDESVEPESMEPESVEPESVVASTAASVEPESVAESVEPESVAESVEPESESVVESIAESVEPEETKSEDIKPDTEHPEQDASTGRPGQADEAVAVAA